MNKYYVYALLVGSEEESLTPFYIGKGCGKRMYNHFKPWSLKQRAYKNNKILAAQKVGSILKAVKLWDNLAEADALEIEQQEILWFNTTSIKLCNVYDGGLAKNYDKNVRKVEPEELGQLIRSFLSRPEVLLLSDWIKHVSHVYSVGSAKNIYRGPVYEGLRADFPGFGGKMSEEQTIEYRKRLSERVAGAKNPTALPKLSNTRLELAKLLCPSQSIQALRDYVSSLGYARPPLNSWPKPPRVKVIKPPKPPKEVKPPRVKVIKPPKPPKEVKPPRVKVIKPPKPPKEVKPPRAKVIKPPKPPKEVKPPRVKVIKPPKPPKEVKPPKAKVIKPPKPPKEVKPPKAKVIKPPKPPKARKLVPLKFGINYNTFEKQQIMQMYLLALEAEPLRISPSIFAREYRLIVTGPALAAWFKRSGTSKPKAVGNKSNGGKATALKSQRPIEQYKGSELIATFSSCHQAALQLGYSQGNIRNVCEGVWPKAYGFEWRYSKLGIKLL